MKDADFKNMSIDERLQIMDSIWASLSQDAVSIVSPDWHGNVLAERKARLDSSEKQFISLEMLKGY
jgi:hypothetical protein